ncbi:MAG: methyl-accepting chemotaxis protein [Methylocystis sp.]|uniref:methyl-accepting chemotaxis protein n=1 Tax=Methylocystis sp. TaxID=1911079 RepID=UPI003DA3C173
MSNVEYTPALREVIRTIRALKAGDLNARANVAGVSGDWAELVSELNAALETTAVNIAENQRARQALDNSVVSMMIADTDGRIFYANRSVLDMLSTAESDVRRDLPNFSASRVVGSNIDTFHRDPRHQRRVLEGLMSTYRTQIVVGGRNFSLVASPIFDNGGRKAAVAVEWIDRTVEARIEKEFIAAIEAAGRGDFSRRVDLSGANGVFKLLGESINKLIEISGACLARVGAGLNRVANGDLTKVADAPLEGAFGSLQSDAEQVRSNLEALVEDVNRLSVAGTQGQLQERADARRHQGDFRKIIQGINETLDSVIGPVRNIAGAIEALGRNDLSANLDGDFRGDFLAVKKAFDAAMTGINNSLYKIVDAVEQVGLSSEQLNSASQGMASNSEEQAAAVQEVTSSVTETNSQVQANTENANAANQLVISASQAASHGQAKMEVMSEAMNAISASAQSIGKIIKVIDEIAFQMNLLALNAAVEAARAGQHGRGFAVVAQEVRNLAGRSAKAARETAEMIEDSVKRVNEGVTIARETSDALDQIVGNVVKVKDLVAEIAVASAEQSRGISQINIAMNQVSKSSQEGSQQAEQLAASASELGKLAEVMNEGVRRFRLRERAHGGGMGLPGLNGMTAEMVEQLKALLGAQQRGLQAPAKMASAGGKHRKSPGAIIPLDQDERGFAGF